MGGFKLTGLAAGTTAGDSVRYEQVSGASALPWTILDAAGDFIQATAADTAARYPAAATVAAHATTTDPWVARVVTLSGGAVTFADIADADYVGQQVLLIMNAAHIWTDGAVFDVQGGATYTTAAGDQVLLVATAVDAFDVTIFPALGPPATQGSSLTLIQSQVASGAATVDFTTGITSTYDEFVVTLTNVVPQTDNTSLYMRVSVDGGSNYLATAEYAYAINQVTTGAANSAAGSTGTAQFLVSSGLGTGTGEVLNGELRLHNLANATVYKGAFGSGHIYDQTPEHFTWTAGCTFKTTSAVNAIRFLMSSGNISGTFTLYGVRKA